MDSKPDFSILTEIVKSFVRTSPMGVEEDLVELSRFHAVIISYFRACCVWNQQLLLTAMNVMEVRMSAFVRNVLLMEVTPPSALPTRRATLLDSFKIKSISLLEAPSAMFELFDDYTKLVNMYSAMSGDNNIKNTKQMIEVHLKAHDYSSGMYEKYKASVKLLTEEDMLKECYAVFCEIEYHIKTRVDFYTDRNEKTLTFTLLKPEQEYLLALMKTQENILNYRDHVCNTQMEPLVKIIGNSISVVQYEKLNSSYTGVGKWFSSIIDSDYVAIRCLVFTHAYHKRFNDNHAEHRVLTINYPPEEVKK